MSQMSTDLRVEVEDDGTVATVRLIGELDLASAPQVRDCFTALFASGRLHVVADLSALDFIDSTGLGVLVAALKRSRKAGGELAVSAATPRVRKVFELTQLDREFLMA